MVTPSVGRPQSGLGFAQRAPRLLAVPAQLPAPASGRSAGVCRPGCRRRQLGRLLESGTLPCSAHSSVSAQVQRACTLAAILRQSRESRQLAGPESIACASFNASCAAAVAGCCSGRLIQAALDDPLAVISAQYGLDQPVRLVHPASLQILMAGQTQQRSCC